MKRARSASRERAATDNDNAKSTEQTEQTQHISLQQIMTLCDVLDNEDAGKIFLAAKAISDVTAKNSELSVSRGTSTAGMRGGEVNAQRTFAKQNCTQSLPSVCANCKKRKPAILAASKDQLRVYHRSALQ